MIKLVKPRRYLLFLDWEIDQLETVNLSSEQWIELVKKDQNFNLPVWIQVISNSMYP